MADKRVTVTIEAVDNASATISKIQKQIEELIAANTINI